MRAVGVGVLKYGFAILVSLWVLLPIYFIIAAFSTEEAVYAYPKQLVPRDASTDTMQFFLDSEDRPLALAKHRGRTAHARDRARGRYPGRLRGGTLRLPRVRCVPPRRRRDARSPIVILSIPLADLPPLGHRRHGAGSRSPTPPRVAVRGPGDVERLRRHLRRARGGRDDARLQPALGGRPDHPAARAARAGRGRDLRLHHLVERGLRRGDPDAARANAAGADPRRAELAAAVQVRGRLLPPRPVADRDLRHPHSSTCGRVVK